VEALEQSLVGNEQERHEARRAGRASSGWSLAGYLQRVVEVDEKMSRKPSSSYVVDPIVIVPVRLTEVSSVVVLVVQSPDFVVDFVVVVETSFTVVSLADTVTSVDPEH
jgi:hypothetical protein